MQKILLALCLWVTSTALMAQNTALKNKAEKAVNNYFLTYTAKHTTFTQQPRLLKMVVDNDTRIVVVITTEHFALQDFTRKQVGKIYKKVKKALPIPYNKYNIQILTNGMPIEQYVPGYVKRYDDGRALWGKIDYKGKAWVSNFSRIAKITHGLSNKHITVWQSHGRYYDNQKGYWKWQRPNLFCTTEDLFTQTIVVPYLIPMLQNAGAVVFTPRERDWQTDEYIIDAEASLNNSGRGYDEYSEGNRWVSTGIKGFAPHQGRYLDNENPFEAGSAQMIKATKKSGKAYVKWQPNFKKAGRYAVYVSYQTLEKSIDDAHYTVFHKGQATEFRVNQRMGGGTWVYLGTFDFDRGDNIYNCVMLTNQSRRRGYVTADAVRFGGGMGNIERGGMVSGYPRALEGARYYAQWAGAPYPVYSSRGGTDDYADDINARSRMLNWLAGGSVFVPTLEGKNVPMELALAIHSDAGVSPNGQDLVGSLAICTTNFNDGRLDAGISRQASKMFADQLLSGVTRDLTYQYKRWARRYLWDRNYSETRLPEVPSAILETLSHQNFPDMLLGHDPNFKFTIARSIYKTIVRYVNDMHGHAAIIQPLAPKDVCVTLKTDKKAEISWVKQDDQQEPTATPTYYILYTATGTGGFDNGKKICSTSAIVNIEPGVQYHFKVTAANRGGESFASEVVSAYVQPGATQTILVVNGFHRLSGPAVINDGTKQGFDLDSDIGVSMGATAGWNGRQIIFDRSRAGIEDATGLGYCGNELAGKIIAGNTFDYISTHADAIASTHRYNVASCSSKAVETGRVNLNDYAAVDVILGMERYLPDALKFYKVFPSSLKRKVTAYTLAGGRLMVSGAYIGSDMQSESDATWLTQTLKTSMASPIKTDTITGAFGLGMSFDFYRDLNPDHYAATHVDALNPEAGAICAMQYSNGLPAATAYDGRNYKTFVMGFPFECVINRDNRHMLMQGIMNYLLK